MSTFEASATTRFHQETLLRDDPLLTQPITRSYSCTMPRMEKVLMTDREELEDVALARVQSMGEEERQAEQLLRIVGGGGGGLPPELALGMGMVPPVALL